MNKTRESCFAAARANSCEGFGTSWWLSISISLPHSAHPDRPEPHHWHDMEWIPARNHQSLNKNGSGPFPLPPFRVRGPVSGNLYPPIPNSAPHVLGPPCQASAPGLINGPAGMAPISWICYNHIRSSLLRRGRSGRLSAPHSRPSNPCRLGQPVSFWLNFPLTNGFKVIIRQGTILHTVETSPSRYRGSAAVFLKAQKKKLDILPRILLLASHLVLLAAYKPA